VQLLLNVRRAFIAVARASSRFGEKKQKSTSEVPVGQKDNQMGRPDQCRTVASDRRAEGVAQ